MQKKLNEISAYEVILCAFVVFIHVLSEAVSGYVRGTFISAAAFMLSRSLTFVVPAFIISSGIKFTHKYKTVKFEYFDFIKARLKKIYLPYVITAIVYYLYFVFLRHYFPFELSELVCQIFMGTVASPFYFIIIIMQFYILTPIWIACCRKLSVMIGVVVSVAVTIVAQYMSWGYAYGDRIFPCYLAFWIIGCYIGLSYERFMAFTRRNKGMLVCAGVLFTLLYVWMAYMEFCGKFHSFSTEAVKILFSIFASIMYLALMPDLDCAVAKKFAPVTYYIYLIHCLILIEVNHVMTDFGIVSLSTRLVIRFFAVYIISTAVALFYGKLRNMSFGPQN